MNEPHSCNHTFTGDHSKGWLCLHCNLELAEVPFCQTVHGKESLRQLAEAQRGLDETMGRCVAESMIAGLQAAFQMAEGRQRIYMRDSFDRGYNAACKDVMGLIEAAVTALPVP